MKSYLYMLLTSDTSKEEKGDAGSGGPSTAGIVDWAMDNVVPILLLVVGAWMIATSRKSKWSEDLGTVASVILGCVVIAGSVFVAFGEDLASLIG